MRLRLREVPVNYEERLLCRRTRALDISRIRIDLRDMAWGYVFVV